MKKYILCFAGITLGISSSAAFLSYRIFSIGQYELMYSPAGHIPENREPLLYSIQDVEDDEFAGYFEKMAIFRGPDNIYKPATVLTKPVNVPEFILYKGKYTPVLSVGAAFKDATSNHIWLNDQIMDLDDEALAGVTGVESLTMPISLRYLGLSSLADRKALKRIYFRAPLPPACRVAYSSQFDDVWTVYHTPENLPEDFASPFGPGGVHEEDDITLFVPRGAVGLYIMMHLFTNIEEYDVEMATPVNPSVPDGLEVGKAGNLKLEVLGYTGSAKTLEIPAEVNSDDYEFMMSMREIPYSVTGIGYRAFSESQVYSVTIPSSVRYVKDEAFAGCAAEEVILGENVWFVGSEAFANMKSLKTLTILPSPDGKRRRFMRTAFEGINPDATLICDFSDPGIDLSDAPYNVFSKKVDLRNGVDYIERSDDRSFAISTSETGLKVSNLSEKAIPVTVIDPSGMTLCHTLLEQGDISIDATPGIYIVRIYDTTRKIVVK